MIYKADNIVLRALQIAVLPALLLLLCCDNISKVEYEGTAELMTPLRGKFHLPRGEHDASFGLIRQNKDSYRFYLRLIKGDDRLLMSSLKTYSKKEVELAYGSAIYNIRVPFAVQRPGRKSIRPDLVIKLSNEDRVSSLKNNIARIPDDLGFDIYKVRRHRGKYVVGKKVGHFYGSFADLYVDGKQQGEKAPPIATLPVPKPVRKKAKKPSSFVRSKGGANNLN